MILKSYEPNKPDKAVGPRDTKLYIVVQNSVHACKQRAWSSCTYIPAAVRSLIMTCLDGKARRDVCTIIAAVLSVYVHMYVGLSNSTARLDL